MDNVRTRPCAYMCVVPSCRICRLLVCINKSKIARQTPFPFVDDAKVETKKSPQKYWSDLGWIWDGFGKFYIFGRYVFPISSANFRAISLQSANTEASFLLNFTLSIFMGL